MVISSVRRPLLLHPLRAGSRSRGNSTASGSPLIIDGKAYPTDSWTNVTPSITSFLPRKLHLQPDHPISLTRKIIESCFPPPTYAHYNTFSPVVSTQQNFDSLCFPSDHPGRAKTDTYYVNAATVLRTHTSAHQVDLFRENKSPGYLISADVYRRDAIDRSHYPIFHQMEGARVWDRRKVPGGDIVRAVVQDSDRLPQHGIHVEHVRYDETTIQREHTAVEARAVGDHLKHVLELTMVKIFNLAKKAAASSHAEHVDDELKMRWVHGSFPFTSPSWELEIYWQGDWLEVLGCGVVKQKLLCHAGVPDQMGWAFGIGLERIAMLLFEIPDIRLFWSQDERFLGQFMGVGKDLSSIKRFSPFSKYPKTYKDVAFWIPDLPRLAGTDAAQSDVHENDVMQIVRDVAGDVVEDVCKVDEFKHPKTGRVSWCYRVNYRSLEKTLTSSEANSLHEKVRGELVRKLGVELR
ncbi:Phenylalanine--tRNA ligase [Podosphaera aphanis]|nr:Phenylalanine--tRNA ligase [Podosphaera aphanis]